MMLLLAAAGWAAETEDAWEQTLDRVVPAVVAIRVNGTRDFDTEDARSSVGTGFIVDAERGLVLTNRHMVHAGPVIADALLIDETEIDLFPVYRDPVHDFGFYRFDPEQAKYLDLTALTLAPEAARVGLEIRVVGNDAGDKISILDGTLSRLDRPAPSYGSSTYNDFNTFYLQAASGTSGGSSGSPVVDVQGRVVALNAGGRREAASSYYLPLDRVVRAFDLVKQGLPVPRGTIQTTFQYTSYDELGRLGLRTETQDAFREAFPNATGMLTVERTVPGGPAHGQLQPGDILVSVNGQRLSAFVPLEAWLDDHVGEELVFDVERGGEPVTVRLTVADLHGVTPDEYLEFGRAVVHDVSYQQARNHAVPASGVYVAQPGYVLERAGVPETAVIETIDGEPVPDLDAAERILAAMPHGRRFTVKYHPIADVERKAIVVGVMDRVFHPMRRCVRDDATGYWPCRDAAEPPPAESQRAGEPLPFSADGKLAQKLAPSLVLVDVDVPIPTAGVGDFHFKGAGLVLDAERGLILVDRDTVPVILCEIEITFAGAVRVPGRVEYLHPTHNLAVISYDPALVTDVPIVAAELSNDPLEPGDAVSVVGIDGDQRVLVERTRVEEIDGLYLIPSGSPKFRDFDVETVELADAPDTVGGAVVDKKGRVRAFWASFFDSAGDNRFFRGIPTSFIPSDLAGGGDETYCHSGVEVGPITVGDALDRGLSAESAQLVVDDDPQRRRMLQVVRLLGGSPAQQVLRGGDILVSARAGDHDGAVTRPGDWEAISAHLCDGGSAALTVLRDGQEQEVALTGVPLSTEGTDRAVVFAGLVVHEPHIEVPFSEQRPPRGPYITWLWYGSPAYRHGIRPTRQILAVNDVPTPDLDALLAAVASIGDRADVRIRTINRQGRVEVDTLRTDLHYWPTTLLERSDDGIWGRTEP